MTPTSIEEVESWNSSGGTRVWIALALVSSFISLRLGIDVAYIRQALGDFPLIGLFGSFELGPLGRKNHLLAYTGVLVLITE